MDLASRLRLSDYIDWCMIGAIMVSLLLLSLSVWMHASADVYMMYILCAKALTHGSDTMAAGYCSVEPAQWVLEWVLVRVRPGLGLGLRTAAV